MFTRIPGRELAIPKEDLRGRAQGCCEFSRVIRTAHPPLPPAPLCDLRPVTCTLSPGINYRGFDPKIILKRFFLKNWGRNINLGGLNCIKNKTTQNQPKLCSEMVSTWIISPANSAGRAITLDWSKKKSVTNSWQSSLHIHVYKLGWSNSRIFQHVKLVWWLFKSAKELAHTDTFSNSRWTFSV